MSYNDERELEYIKRPRWSSGSVPWINHDTPTFMRRKYAFSPDRLEGADVAIIGAPYVASWGPLFSVDKALWYAAAKRVRQQSARYVSGYLQSLDLDVFEHLKVVDFGDAEIPEEIYAEPTVNHILAAQDAVGVKVRQALDAGAIPIVIGQNSPVGSYAIAKVIAERTKGNVGMISIDTHWDIEPIDDLTMDPEIAGSTSWKGKMYEFHNNMLQKNLVEIGEHGCLLDDGKEQIREFLKKGTHFYPMWTVRQKGIEWLCKEIKYAYENTEAVYLHFDMDVMGGAGPSPGDVLGQLVEPIGMSDYEILRLAFEIGKKGFDALSFICIPPGSAAGYRVVVMTIMYILAGKILSDK
ncbi:arginase family protein [Thermoproteota archaeon]